MRRRGRTYEPDEDESVDVVVRGADSTGDSGGTVPRSVKRRSEKYTCSFFSLVS